MEKSLWGNYIDEKGKPLWGKIIMLLMAFGIASAIGNFAYKEVFYKKEIPIESMKTEWQFLGTTIARIGGQDHTGELYYESLSVDKKVGKITIWIKIKTHEPVTMREGKNPYTYDEHVARWTIDCGPKEAIIDYFAYYLKGKKQLSGKGIDKRVPISEGTTLFQVYQKFCLD